MARGKTAAAGTKCCKQRSPDKTQNTKPYCVVHQIPVHGKQSALFKALYGFGVDDRQIVKHHHLCKKIRNSHSNHRNKSRHKSGLETFLKRTVGTAEKEADEKKIQQTSHKNVGHHHLEIHSSKKRILYVNKRRKGQSKEQSKRNVPHSKSIPYVTMCV